MRFNVQYLERIFEVNLVLDIFGHVRVSSVYMLAPQHQDENGVFNPDIVLNEKEARELIEQPEVRSQLEKAFEESMRHGQAQ
jgi:hypothetical protein